MQQSFLMADPLCVVKGAYVVIGPEQQSCEHMSIDLREITPPDSLSQRTAVQSAAHAKQ